MLFLKTFIRKSSFYAYLLIALISFTALLIFINITSSINDEINRKSEHYTNRELILSSKDDINSIKDKIKNQNNIVEVYNYISSVATFDNNFLTVNTFVKEKNLNMVSGRGIEKNETNVVILPNSFTKYLNQTIKLNIEGVEQDYKVVGIYKDDLDKTEYAYISYTDNFNIESVSNTYILLVDNYDNVNIVKTKLLDDGYKVTIDTNSISENIETLNTLKIVFNILTLIIIIFICLFLYFIIKNILEDEKYDIAILKSIGYKNILLFKINLLKTFIIIFASLLIGTMLSYLFIILLNRIHISFINFYIYYKSSSLLITYLIGLIILILSSFYSKKEINKIKPIIIFNDEQF